MASVEERVIHMIAQLSTVRPAQIRPADRLREDLGLDSVCSMELLSMLAEDDGLAASHVDLAQVGVEAVPAAPMVYDDQHPIAPLVPAGMEARSSESTGSVSRAPAKNEFGFAAGTSFPGRN